MISISNKFSVVVLSAIVLLAFSSCVTQPKSIEEYFTQLNSRGYSGAILVARDGTTLTQQAFGYASCDQTTRNTIDTVFSIGSITKDFTRAAIAQLDAEGKIKLDHAISSYLTTVPNDKAGITVEQLLDHRSGLRTYHETQNIGDFESQTKEQALSEIFRGSLLFRPGSRENYSNSGYTVLAAIIEAVSGQSYVDYIRENLLI
ncbi:MAG: serine hydrolase domain-containing protein, partial [Pseudohongiellaceae bacterium]